jgi:hypothetical protein
VNTESNVKKTIDYTDDELQQAIELANVRMDELFAERKSWDKKFDAARAKQERFVNEKARRQHEAMIATNTTDWGLLLTYEAYEPYYKMLNEALLQRSPDLGVSQSGYSPDAMQYMLRVKFTRGDKDEVTKAAALISEILPVMKATDEDGRYVMFGIFDRGLSEYETYYLAYELDKKHWVVGTHRAFKGRRDFDHKPFKKLEDALTCVSNNYWYELPENEREDD